MTRQFAYLRRCIIQVFEAWKYYRYGIPVITSTGLYFWGLALVLFFSLSVSISVLMVVWHQTCACKFVILVQIWTLILTTTGENNWLFKQTLPSVPTFAVTGFCLESCSWQIQTLKYTGKDLTIKTNVTQESISSVISGVLFFP